MWLWRLFWDKWLEWPLGPLKEYLDVDLASGQALTWYKIVATVLLVLVLVELLSRTRRGVRRLFYRDDDFLDLTEESPGTSGNAAFTETLEAAKSLESTIAPLKKAKQYARIAEIYSRLNRPREAARWFQKARDRKRAAHEWARAGKTARAARLLMKEGDYVTAARFYEETGAHGPAALAFIKMGQMGRAGAAYAKAGKYKAAFQVFEDYFASTADPVETQVAAADACFAMLTSAEGGKQLGADARQALWPALAARFERAQRLDLAARLYLEVGDPARAGEVYARAGQFERAAQCFNQAGRTRDAAVVAGRYHEQQGRWREAGAAYASAGDWHKAGECYARAEDSARAAGCFEKAGEYYGAALAYSHLGQFEKAIHLLQRIKESDRRFDVSRALLGRCFYELKNYEHCVAALENHLTGKRVETGNMDYFYMLALAHEQVGNLERSREILYRLRSVDVEYKDVTRRLSSIASRISLGAGAPAGARTPAVSPSEEQTQVMTMVENLLGQRYRLEQELGRGGMGVVYLARDTQLERPVALKFLGSLVDGSEEYRQRFIREAKAAARVSHPNIIGIYDISASLGRAYIAMEYVEGPNLHRHIQSKERLSPREAVNIALQACSALEAIHNAGIVHRDIKPDNILIARGGLVKLTDFGLAKAENARITGANVVMGTPAYMSPEQTRGSDVDARSDIYSIGLVLHEMLTGQTVFHGGDIIQRQQAEVPPKPGALAEGIPPGLDDVVMKCLEKDPDRRYPDISSLIDALRKIRLEA